MIRQILKAVRRRPTNRVGWFLIFWHTYIYIYHRHNPIYNLNNISYINQNEYFTYFLEITFFLVYLKFVGERTTKRVPFPCASYSEHCRGGGREGRLKHCHVLQNIIIYIRCSIYDEKITTIKIQGSRIPSIAPSNTLFPFFSSSQLLLFFFFLTVDLP